MTSDTFNREMRSYLSKKLRKPFFSFKKKLAFLKNASLKNTTLKKDAKDAYDEYNEFSGVSDSTLTVLKDNETVFDTMKKSVTSFLPKEKPLPAFDEQGNIIHSGEESEPSKSGNIVSNIFSKLDNVLGKKNDVAAQAEYAEFKEFEEVVQSNKDLKELARISALLLRQLSQEKLDEFKRGDDFRNYKDILKKNGIIK